MADKKKNPSDESASNMDLSLDDLLARLRDEHGVEFGKAPNGQKNQKQVADSDQLDEFEFDDRPIEADYLNYNIIGRSVGDLSTDDATEDTTVSEDTIEEDTSVVVEAAETPKAPPIETSLASSVEGKKEILAEKTDEADAESSEAVAVEEAEEAPVGDAVDEIETILEQEIPDQVDDGLPWEEDAADESHDAATDDATEIALGDADSETEEVDKEDFLYRSVRERYLAQRGLLHYTEKESGEVPLPNEPSEEKIEDTEDLTASHIYLNDENGFSEDDSVADLLADLLDDMDQSCGDVSLTAEDDSSSRLESSIDTDAQDDQYILYNEENRSEINDPIQVENVVGDGCSEENAEVNDDGEVNSSSDEDGTSMDELPWDEPSEQFSDKPLDDGVELDRILSEYLKQKETNQTVDLEQEKTDHTVDAVLTEEETKKETVDGESDDTSEIGDVGSVKESDDTICDDPDDTVDADVDDVIVPFVEEETSVEGDRVDEGASDEVTATEDEATDLDSAADEEPVPDNDDGTLEYDLASAYGIKSRDSHVKPKKRGKGSSTPIEDERSESFYAKKSVLPSRRGDKEYTAYAQSEYIKKGYQNKFHRELVRLVWLIAITIVAFVTESLHLVGIDFLRPTSHPILAVVISSLLILVACFLTLWEYVDGAVMLIRGRPVPESMMLFAVLSPLVYYIVSLAQGVPPASLFGFAFCVCAMICKLQTVFRILREAKTFAVVSQEKPKRVLSKLTKEQSGREADVFGTYVSSDAEYYCSKRTLFVDDYFKLTNAISRNKIVTAVFLVLSVGIAGGIFLLANYKGVFSTLGAVAYAIISFFYTMPFSCLLLYEVPLLWATFSASEEKSAIIGESAIENYSGDGVVSFSDSDIFPPSDIALVNILLFGERHVEKMMNYTALVFDEINSSVSTVLMRSIPHYKMDDEIRIANIYDNGIEAYINGEQVLVGGYDFMTAFGAGFPHSYVYEENGMAQMFTAVGGEVLGRFDLDYTLDLDTAQALAHLAEGGLYIAIRTLDPNLTPEFLSGKIDYNSYPIKLMKVGDDRELLRMRKRVASPIVTCGRTKSLMRTLVLCDKSALAQKVGIIFAAASMLAGTCIMLISVMLGNSVFISGRGIALYQFFWLLPVFLTSVICVRSKKAKKKGEKKKKVPREK